MVFLTVTVSVPSLRPPECTTNTSCEPASKLQVRIFYIALYVVALGAGGVKPCFSSLGAQTLAHQYPSTVEKTLVRLFLGSFTIVLSN